MTVLGKMYSEIEILHKKCNFGLILISKNKYFAGTYQRTGGGCEVCGELWDCGL